MNWDQLLIKDHETTEKVLDSVTKMLGEAGGATAQVVRLAMDYLQGYADACHNQKEEQYLFPTIEARGIPRHGGPLAVMLDEHGRSKDLVIQLQPLAAGYIAGEDEATKKFPEVFAEYAALLKDHYWKENDILYNLARRVMTSEDAEKVKEGIFAVEKSLGEDTHEKYYAMADEIERLSGLQDLIHAMPPHLLAAMMNALPIELSFVDEHDVVRYFSHEKHTKIFPRTRGVVGRPVQQCHPPKSVHLVNQILTDFKAGKREVAEFWIEMAGKKLHIRYFPVRDGDGKYIGCLETVQDITEIQKLTGERRLLSEEA